MKEELLTFTTDNLGRIRLDQDGPSPAAGGVIDKCCCRNEHKPVDGFISTDPGCKIHGLTRVIILPGALEEEAAIERREQAGDFPNLRKQARVDLMGHLQMKRKLTTEARKAKA